MKLIMIRMYRTQKLFGSCPGILILNANEHSFNASIFQHPTANTA